MEFDHCVIFELPVSVEESGIKDFLDNHSSVPDGFEVTDKEQRGFWSVKGTHKSFGAIEEGTYITRIKIE